MRGSRDELVEASPRLHFQLGRVVFIAGRHLRLGVRPEVNQNNRHDAWVTIRPAMELKRALEEMGCGRMLSRFIEGHRMTPFLVDAQGGIGEVLSPHEGFTDAEGEMVIRDLPDDHREYGLLCLPCTWGFDL
ncbi:MAG: hypothetical protein HY459_00065 [Parcubacteria group bacterium]|nr:hypothetical protein [Parcubacteria group bacterium]